MNHRILRPLFVVLTTIGLIGTPVLAENHEETVGVTTVLAKVGETEITVGHVLVSVEDINPQQRQIPPEELFAELLERLIQQEQLVQQLESISTLTQLQMDNERRSLLATQVVERILGDVIVLSDETEALFNERYGDLEAQREFNASHILVETEEEALALISELDDGMDFGALARKHSIGPSGPSGGNLGWFGRGRMVPEFQAAVNEMDVDTVSAPVQTQFGWHVIKLLETRVPNAPSSEEAMAQLENEVRQRKFRTAVAAALTVIPVERFEVGEVDPAKLFRMISQGGPDE